MARAAWLFLFLLLCVAIWLAWQSYTRPIETVAPVIIELEKEFVNPNLPTGQPVNAVIVGDTVKEIPTAIEREKSEQSAFLPVTNSVADNELSPDYETPSIAKGYFVSLSPIDGRAENTLCVFDPIGNSGDVYSIMKSFQQKSMEWGASIHLKVFTDEGLLVDEFKSGKCDGAFMTGSKVRSFNRFTATLEAVGTVPDQQIMNTVLIKIADMKPSLAEKYLKNGNYEIAGIVPIGAVYAFSSHRNMFDSVNAVQGKRVTVLEGDSVSQQLIREVDGSPVMATTTSFAGKFNNGSVDFTFAPAAAYEPLELYRGLGENGGILDFPVSQMTMQLVINRKKFPDGFTENARATFAHDLGDSYEWINKAKSSIDPKYWVKPNSKHIPAYTGLMRKLRIQLRDEGLYDGKMLKLLHKIRCKRNPNHAECAENLE